MIADLGLGRFAAERPRAPAQREDAVFDSGTILIVDEGGYGALDLSTTIEELDGLVAGPVCSVSEALTILDSVELCGAVVDLDSAHARDVAALLVERDIPVVILISTTLGSSLPGFKNKVSVLGRPVDPRMILESLLIEIGKSEMRASNVLGSIPKQV
jgi:hypothetical protein